MTESSVIASQDVMDGLISFWASHHALRADKVLGEAGFVVALVPGPRELSPNCGVALRCELARMDAVLLLLAQSRVQIDEVHPYRPRIIESGQVAPQPAPSGRSKFARLWGRS